MTNSSNENPVANITADIEGKYITRTEIDSIIGEIFNNSVVNIDALKQHIPVNEIIALVVSIVNNKIQEYTNRDIKITNLRLEDMNYNICGTGNIINPNCNTSNTTIVKVDEKTSNVVKKPLISIRQATEEELRVFQYYNEIDSSDEENEDKITLKKYLLEVEDCDDIRSMFMGMILDLKERIKGCEQCETCSEVIKIVDKFVADYKKIYKLADQMANLFMQFIINKSKLKLNPNQKKLLEFIFIIIMKNSSFSDLEYIYKCFHNNIDVNMYDGLAFRLAIQKHNSTNIEKLISWGADITIRNHRSIVRAFYHERFKTIKLLMEKGSSYKYYLMSELDKDEYEYVYKEIQKLINDDLPDNADIDELSKEYKFLDILIKYIIIRTKENKKENQLDDSDFIYDFVEHLNINLDNIKIKPNTTDTTDAIDKVAKVSKVEKNKKDILEQKTLSKAQVKLMKLEEQRKLEAKKEKKKEKKKLQKERKLQQQTSNISNTSNTSSIISNPTVIDTENTGKTTTSNVDVDVDVDVDITTPVDSNNIHNNELTTELIVNTEINNKVVEKDNNFGFEFDVNDYYFNYYNNHFKKVFEQYSPEHKFIHYARIEGL